MRVPRRFYDSLTVDFQARRKNRSGHFFRILETPRQYLPLNRKFLPSGRQDLPRI